MWSSPTPIQSKHPRHSVLKCLQKFIIFLCYITIQNNGQNNEFSKCNFYVNGQQTRKEKVPNRKIAEQLKDGVQHMVWKDMLLARACSFGTWNLEIRQEEIAGLRRTLEVQNSQRQVSFILIAG
jgi:hypothetical protein